MDPVDLIKQDLGPDGWNRCRESWAEGSIVNFQAGLSIFRDYRIYLVHGQTGQFDFPMLPRCSIGYYAANGKEALRLTRAGKEIERILAAEWPLLASQNPVKLASFLLRFYDEGIKASHRVLADADELLAMCAAPRKYRINERAFAKALPAFGVTSCKVDANTLKLRAVTLCGWMHCSSNLGIETIGISQDGAVHLGQREVLAENIFDEVPRIMY